MLICWKSYPSTVEASRPADPLEHLLTYCSILNSARWHIPIVLATEWTSCALEASNPLEMISHYLDLFLLRETVLECLLNLCTHHHKTVEVA